MEFCGIKGDVMAESTLGAGDGTATGEVVLSRAGQTLATGRCTTVGRCTARAPSDGSALRALPGEAIQASCNSLGVLQVRITCSADLSVSLDTTPPDTTIVSGPSGFTQDRTPTFAFNSDDLGARFECRLDQAAWFGCSSPHTTAQLGDGTHAFEVRAIDRAGNVDPSPAGAAGPEAARRTFVVGLPPPLLGRRFNAEPLRGTVLFSLPGRRARAAAAVRGLKGRRFRALSEPRQLPVGSLLDTRRGTVRLTSARNTRGAIQSGRFVSGVFQVVQARSGRARGLMELRLKGSSFGGCRAGHARRARAARLGPRAHLARHRSGRVVRRVRGNARGRFKTTGRLASATVRSTVWSTSDRCDGTLTRVRRGRVTVRDIRRRRSIRLVAGRSYLVRAAGAGIFGRLAPQVAGARCPAARSPQEGPIVGSDGHDRISGTNGRDLILALAGNDRVSGGGGDDCLEGNGGSDQLDGSSGRDRLLGGAGADTLSGGLGRDRLLGESGRDSLSGGGGSDVLRGGSGRDRMQGGFGNDLLFGGPGNDGIHTGNGRDRVSAGPGDDIVNAATSGPPALVDCGPGHDRVRINNNERSRIRNCELVDVFVRIRAR